LNLDQYRALKEQEAKEVQTQTTEVKQPEKTEIPQQVETKSEEKKVEDKKEEVVETTPQKIVIDGQEITIDELKNGYLRQSDYTRKTQALSKERKQIEEAMTLYQNIQANPQIAEQLKQANLALPKGVDPATAMTMQLMDEIQDLKLDLEIKTMQDKYSDFDVRAALETVQKEGLNNLEEAYLRNKSRMPVDVEAIRKQVRDEIKAEFEKEKNSSANADTQTLISSNNQGTQIAPTEIRVSKDEEKVAKMMFRDSKDPIADYAKWRDMPQRKGG
jgi:hypothetical protein